jgi:hypothetical protein
VSTSEESAKSRSREPLHVLGGQDVLDEQLALVLEPLAAARGDHLVRLVQEAAEMRQAPRGVERPAVPQQRRRPSQCAVLRDQLAPALAVFGFEASLETAMAQAVPPLGQAHGVGDPQPFHVVVLEGGGHGAQRTVDPGAHQKSF